MNKVVIFIFALSLPLSVFAAKFVHPLDFKGSAAEKDQVITQIINN